MTAILDTMTTIGIFLAGIVARFGIVLLVMLLLLAPVLLVLGAGRGLSSVRRWLQGYRQAGRLRFRGGLAYAPGHTWLKDEGGTLKVGLDDLAQGILPWTVAAELPAPGRSVRAGEPVATLSCGGRSIQVAAPVSGRVLAVNTELVREPTLAKSDSYGAGWLFAMEPEGEDWKRLPVGDRARAWLRSEGERLERFYEAQLGLAAADGGELVGAPDALLDDAQWKALARSFLRT